MIENKTPLVSVIVPVYNVAPYIERCAKSLFEQTLKDIEIIFVDDCSPDNSIELVKNLQATILIGWLRLDMYAMIIIGAWRKQEKLVLILRQVSMWRIAIRMITFPWRCMRNYMMKRRGQSRRLCIAIL